MIHMRPFTPQELRNQQYLVNLGISFTQVQITETGLKKGILDATAPMRAYFKENNIHDYELQLQGPDYKYLVSTHILTFQSDFITQTSLYRPVTKKGDPRLWIYKLQAYTQPNDIHILIAHDGDLLVINSTREDIKQAVESVLLNPIKEHLLSISDQAQAVSRELLQHFRKASGQWFESEILADTGIGRTIETLLGIPMNSDKTADYKGIELKSARGNNPGARKNLFTQTPNWELSRCKSGQEIVSKYGYFTEEGFKTIQTTVSATHPTRDLQLMVNDLDGLLELQHIRETGHDDVAVWQLLKLHERLLTKHHETFWINVENRIENNKEYFRYDNIIHTKNPNIGQFDVLLGQGMITVDLLICRPSFQKSGRTGGDTYSFKLKSKAMPLLFPESLVYKI